MNRVPGRPGTDGIVGIEPSPLNALTTIGPGSHHYEVGFYSAGSQLRGIRRDRRDPCDGTCDPKIANIRTPAEPKTT